ncbi:MAG: hypothetical protein ACI8ZM_003902 [Crocinitomix sp.]|jgi:hypothetical protein
MAGNDAKGSVYAELKAIEDTNGVLEQAGFFAKPGDRVRKVAMSYLMELFDVAWAIKNENIDEKTAREKYFGIVINKTNKTL